MDYKITKLTENEYKDWDEFCLESAGAWFWHTADTLEYILNYKPELKTKNFSFFIGRQNKILAIIPLILEVIGLNENYFFEFSFSGCGGAIPAPALSNNLTTAEQDLIYRLIFTEIDRLAAESKVKRLRLRLRPLFLDKVAEGGQYKRLISHGFNDISLSTQLIDLRKEEKVLWDELRRNHRRSILKGDKFEIKFYDNMNITKGIFYEYKEMHHKASGRKTRPNKTFELMFDQAKRGFGFLVVASLNQKNIGFEFYTIYKKQAEGFSAANDPDFEYLPIRHRLEWEAMLWMKSRDMDFYDIGIQQSGPLPYDLPTAKEINISHFKKGFGGQTVPLLTLEKFYDKKYFCEINEIRKKEFADYINKHEKSIK